MTHMAPFTLTVAERAEVAWRISSRSEGGNGGTCVEAGLVPERIKAVWRISSRSGSGNGGTCVEAGPVVDACGCVAVRHSQQPDADLIVCSGAEWKSFVDTLRSGTLDF